ncbi:MAG: hypothetical protein ABIN61_06715 [candidate division WOR-3 bacterium]
MIFFLLFSVFEGEFFLVGIDAESWGRGGSGVVYPTTGYKNPASSLIMDPILYLNGSKLFGDLANFISGGLSLNQIDYGFGIHFILHSVGDIYDTRNAWNDENESGYPEEGEEFYDGLKSSFFSRESALLATYARWIGNFSVGMGVKFIYKKIQNALAVGAGVDVGIIYEMENYSIGGVIRDIFTSPLFWDGRTEYIEPSFLLGMGFKRKVGRMPILFEVDLLKDDFGVNHNLGIEIGLNDWLKIRGGFFNDQLTLGCGVMKKEFNVNYALSLHSDLLISHRVSLSYRLR